MSLGLKGLTCLPKQINARFSKEEYFIISPPYRDLLSNLVHDRFPAIICHYFDCNISKYLTYFLFAVW